MDHQTFTNTVSELLASRQPDESASFIVHLNNQTEIHTDHYEFEEGELPVKWVRLYRKDHHKTDDGKNILYPIAVVKLRDIDAVLDHSNWC
jgi:hypothetical protein